ncbi:uncharacterized protein LOC100890407 [Strongylocentrotus purpuratus]|uniref:Interferon regulatory factor-3 domain-containing protein n=1 Tax=Strongylocentrotus purpuratus TaxID=7668 RepID=A0A7M7GIR1_STRPU|nr:uncharacterized protein LOC100890407 [Strongylocentrotus purpuratus]
MSTMNDGVDLSSFSESMDVDFFPNLSNGLQQDFGADIELLDSISLSDLLASPSPNNGFTHFDAMEAMEANSSEAAAIQVNPENDGGFSQNSYIQSPFSNPMLSAVSPMTPQAHAVPVVSLDDGSVQSERIDSSLADIDPMRVNSENVRETLMADPNALGESLGSIELNATRNASIQSIEHRQVPSASRMATQRQALPDSSQTQAISGTSANGTTATSGGYFSDYELPEFDHFKVSVKFMSTPMLEKVVTKKGGCLLHYQPSDQAPILVPDEVERISIPVKTKNEKDGSLKEFPWVKEKQKRFTELILQGFHRGVEFYSREGNIYVKRSSNTKLFWQSTQEEPGIAKELSRNKETEVFNWGKFQQSLGISVALGNRTNLRLPAVWFSFAQKWDRDSSPITTKLVWARVDPTRACEMVKNVNPDVRSTEYLESLHSSLIGISNEASQSVSQ